jgi:hypothetical protein
MKGVCDMTDKEIKKALECCIDNQHCWLCVLRDRENDCYELEKSALDLINRQQAEIERLNVELVGMRGACNSYKVHYDKAKAEIERLRENNKAIMQTIADVHTEAIKEFAKFLIDKAEGNTILIGDLPDFVIEMVGEDKC